MKMQIPGKPPQGHWTLTHREELRTPTGNRSPGDLKSVKACSNAKECSNYHTIAFISHASKVMLKILQARLQQYVNRELPDVQAGFRKGRGTRANSQHPLDHIKSKRIPEKHLLQVY